MGLLKTKTKEIHYTGSKTYYINGTSMPDTSEVVPTTGDDNNNFVHSLSMFEDCIIADDIRVYFRDDTADTQVEVFDFTVTDTSLTDLPNMLTPIISITEDGDVWQMYRDIDEDNTTGALIIELRDYSFGGYRYASLADIVNSFMVAYVGDGKLITNVAKSDVLFHAKRGIAEFSYDVLKTVKIQEVELSTALTIPMPQDYVSYVKLAYTDSSGIKRTIYPTRLTLNPTEAITQDNDYNYVYDNDGDTVTGSSYTETQWQAFDTNNITGSLNVDNDYYLGTDNYLQSDFGRRYGLNPEHQQINGYFTIDERTGSFAFSSDLSGKIITIEYVSDSLGTDAEMKVHKFAEEALYKHIAFNVLSTKRNIPEYIVQRFKKERRAALRNAKLRLSKLNLEYMAQVMRGKGKQIKN
jgi:hypothetical protein|tara:strand:- start:664 stop:1893 length:1230 start_codon:yes stop_codon:yes gene_type:complete